MYVPYSTDLAVLPLPTETGWQYMFYDVYTLTIS